MYFYVKSEAAKCRIVVEDREFSITPCTCSFCKCTVTKFATNLYICFKACLIFSAMIHSEIFHVVTFTNRYCYYRVLVTYCLLVLYSSAGDENTI